MDIAITFLLILLSAAFVAWPFLRPPVEGASLPPLTGLGVSDAERQKAEAYAAIKEAEFDHEMGKLTDADLATQREKYAAQAMAAITVLQADATPTAPRRATKPNGRIAFCPQCGTPVAKGANFCGTCGTSLKALAA